MCSPSSSRHWAHFLGFVRILWLLVECWGAFRKTDLGSGTGVVSTSLRHRTAPFDPGSKMANRTDPLAQTIHGKNPQLLFSRIVRRKVYESTFWKNDCFACTAESIVDVAIKLQYVGGTYGGIRAPSPFLCVVLKLLQIQPEKEIILEYLKQEDFKYLRAVAAFYLRLTARSDEVYLHLEPLLADYRKLRMRAADGTFTISHVDEFVDDCLNKGSLLDVGLPPLAKRSVFVQEKLLPPVRLSALEHEADATAAAEPQQHALLLSKQLLQQQQKQLQQHVLQQRTRALQQQQEKEMMRQLQELAAENGLVETETQSAQPTAAAPRRSVSPNRRARKRSPVGRLERQREAERDKRRRETERERDRDRDRDERERMRYRDYRVRDRERDRDRDRDRERQRERERDRERERERDRCRERERGGERERARRDRERDRDRGRDRDREKDGNRDRRRDDEHKGGSDRKARDGDLSVEEWNNVRQNLGLKPLKQ